MSDAQSSHWVVDDRGYHFPWYLGVGKQAAGHESTTAVAAQGLLSTLLDGQRAVQLSQSSVMVPHDTVARLDSDAAKQLRLPEPGSWTLRLRIEGTIARATGFSWHFVGRNRRAVHLAGRVGTLARTPEGQFLIKDPLFSIVERVEAFNGDGFGERNALVTWARLLPEIDDSVDLDPHLSQVEVALCTGFQIEPRLDERAEPTFDVIPGRIEATGEDDPLESERSFVPALPQVGSDGFNQVFRKFPRARAQYPCGAASFVVLDEPVQKSLAIVRRVLTGDVETRRAFLKSPAGFLKEALDSDEGVDVDVDELLWDEGYSDRVVEIGLWHPKVLPWLKPSERNTWLPEELGIRVGDQMIRLDPKDLPDIRQQLITARAGGQQRVVINGATVPATQEAIDVIGGLLGRVEPEPDDKIERRDQQQNPPFALIVVGNLEAVGFTRQPRKTTSRPGTIPSSLGGVRLYKHQRAALQWLQDHWCNGSPGALLADDMGLGKTLESLAFLAWLDDDARANAQSRKPFVVIAPTGLLKTWRAEHDKHLEGSGLGHVVEAFGSGLRTLKRTVGEAGERRSGLPTLDVRQLKDADWVLTTYETWRDYQFSFGRVDWAVAVLDEVQKIKNPKAAVTEAVKAVKADFILALSGTPVENRMADLWCVVDAVQPSRLGALKDFSRKYEGNGVDEQGLKGLRDELLKKPPSIMLRRLKEDHLDGLPDKHVHLYADSMPATQASAYRDCVLEAKASSGDRGAMLKTLQRLRSVSLHPYAPGATPDERYVQESARLARACSILDGIAASGEKALVFVESLELQGYSVGMLTRRYGLEAPPLVISGKVSGPRRQGRVDVFQERSGFDVMLLSPKAGGVGLTLTAANHVIHLSRWWNPAVEDQCTDRVYRIGQDRAVHVHLPLAKHPEFGDASFDIQLNALLTRKRDLSRRLLAAPVATGEDLTNLYTISIGGGAVDDDTLRHVDQLEGTSFERWVAAKLQKSGYVVDGTRPTGDRGVDLVAMHRPSGQRWLIQCKHTQNPQSPCSGGGVLDLIRGRDAYGNVTGSVLVTNARTFSRNAQQMAREQGIKLVARGGLNKLGTW